MNTEQIYGVKSPMAQQRATITLSDGKSYYLSDGFFDNFWKKTKDALKQKGEEVAGEGLEVVKKKASDVIEKTLEKQVGESGGGSIPDREVIENEVEKASERDANGTSQTFSFKEEGKKMFRQLKTTSPLVWGFISGMATMFYSRSIWASIGVGIGFGIISNRMNAYFERKGFLM